MGIASRREAETWIKEGRIKVNGTVITEMGHKIDPDVDEVFLNNKPVIKKAPSKVYWLLHKPDKTLTSRRSQGEQATIFELPSLAKVPFLVFPVGRLDYRTEGLLLLSNDGELVHRLAHPTYKLPRHYQVLVSGRLSAEEEKKLTSGIVLEDGPVKKVDLHYAHGQNMGASRGSWYFITVYEGRNRLVRRLFEAVGHKVVRLIRTGFGDLRLSDDLHPGEYRQLTSEEIRQLKKETDLA